MEKERPDEMEMAEKETKEREEKEKHKIRTFIYERNFKKFDEYLIKKLCMMYELSRM